MKNRNPNDIVSPGVKLEYTFNGHEDVVYWIAWAPDGQTLASGSEDRTIRLWNPQTGQLLHALGEHAASVLSIAWSPDGQILAAGSEDQTIRLWDVNTGKLLLAFAGYHTTTGYPDTTLGIMWSADGQTLASVPIGNTVSLWDPKTGRKTRILEGHAGRVMCISESLDGRLLASKSSDGEVRIWRSDMWEVIAILDEAATDITTAGSLAFCPTLPILATSSNSTIRIWNIDINALLTSTSSTTSVHYTNAKVILVGDSGVGKSGLGLVLTGQPFVPTESTHGRNIRLFDQQEVLFDNEHMEERETLLWDLAGQPGYRLVHQLHLDEVTVALIVFNPHSETDPFAGIHHWTRALRTAQRIQGGSWPMKTLLVAARMDRGGPSVSNERINALIQELQFDGYYETSAKEGMNIEELVKGIREAIDWNVLPRVTSTVLFQSIKAFLRNERNAGRLLSTLDDLYRIFVRLEQVQDNAENLRAQFESCMGAMETEGLIRRFSFGNLILLQPELLDAYTSALVNAVRDEPDGLGSISETKTLKADFFIPTDNRIGDEDQERLLLIAVIEDLLRYEIALREQGEDGPYLVFPSQSTREFPDLPDPEGKTVLFTFEGPVLNIYTALAVRLSHSGIFKKKEIWKNTVVYEATVGGTCGILLRHVGEGRGEMTLFFDKRSSEETRFHFEEFVYTHLQRRAMPDSIQRRRIFICNECGTPMPDQIVQTRLKRGKDWLHCPVCETPLSLLDRVERLSAALTSVVVEMDRLADQAREREAAQSTVSGKRAAKYFDVFLCYTHENKLEVMKIGEQLKERGILPWLDEWELQPGLPWQPALEEQMERIKSVAVFVGTSGTSPWQDLARSCWRIEQGCEKLNKKTEATTREKEAHHIRTEGGQDMSLKSEGLPACPEETVRLAHIVCPKGDLCLWIGDELSEVFQDPLFASLFPRRGQPAEAPWRLALVTVLQFVEGLSDRAAADAVRKRIDWKYALRLELDNLGFDFSVLSEFRTRLVKGGGEQLLFDALLTHAKDRGWLKARGRQRTDSTHVLAVIETLSRLECVAETLRHALNVLASVVADWLQERVPPEWYERYATRWQDYRLPSGREEREELAAMIGSDGRHLLDLIETTSSMTWLRALPAIQTLQWVWLQQFYADESAVRWRDAKDLPPSSLLICTPYDPEARYSQKRTTTWTGYKVHLTESCDEDTPHLITDVQTTPAPLSDFDMTPPIQAALAERQLLPKEQLLDMGYVTAEHLVASQSQYQVDLVGPVAPDSSWQAQSNTGFGSADFTIDWQEKRACCPQGCQSVQWLPWKDRHGHEIVHIKFAARDCSPCPVRHLCTHAAKLPRTIAVRAERTFMALQTARQRQLTPGFKEVYAKRAGIEGTLSQGVRAFGLRRSRYVGEAKTRLQHFMIASALNIVRLFAWSEEQPREPTRRSRFATLAPSPLVAAGK